MERKWIFPLICCFQFVNKFFVFARLNKDKPFLLIPELDYKAGLIRMLIVVHSAHTHTRANQKQKLSPKWLMESFGLSCVPPRKKPGACSIAWKYFAYSTTINAYNGNLALSRTFLLWGKAKYWKCLVFHSIIFHFVFEGESWKKTFVTSSIFRHTLPKHLFKWTTKHFFLYWKWEKKSSNTWYSTIREMEKGLMWLTELFSIFDIRFVFFLLFHSI